MPKIPSLLKWLLILAAAFLAYKFLLPKIAPGVAAKLP